MKKLEIQDQFDNDLEWMDEQMPETINVQEEFSETESTKERNRILKRNKARAQGAKFKENLEKMRNDYDFMVKYLNVSKNTKVSEFRFSENYSGKGKIYKGKIDFLEKLKRNKKLRDDIQFAKIDKMNAMEGLETLDNQVEFFDFMRDEKLYEKKLGKLEQYYEKSGKTDKFFELEEAKKESERKLKNIEIRVENLIEKMTKSVTCVNSLMKDCGLNNEKSWIKGPSSEFDLEDFETKLKDIKQHFAQYYGENDIRDILKGRKKLEQVLEDFRSDDVKDRRVVSGKH